MTASDIDRIKGRCVITRDGCWLWQGSMTTHGYGRVWVRGRIMLPHRATWEALHGPIADGMTFDHLCRRRDCCNPDHGELVTIGENIRRGTGPTALNAVKTHCPAGHPYNDQNTYIWRKMRFCRACKRTRARAARAT